MRRLVVAGALLLSACAAPWTAGGNSAATRTPAAAPAPSTAGTETSVVAPSTTETSGPGPGTELQFQGSSGERQVKIDHLVAGDYDVGWQTSGSCSFSVSLVSSSSDSNGNSTTQNSGSTVNGQASGHTIVSTSPQQTYVLRISAAGQDAPCAWTVTVKRT